MYIFVRNSLFLSENFYLYFITSASVRQLYLTFCVEDIEHLIINHTLKFYYAD